MKYRIIVTARAMRDADAAGAWIATQSQERAERWYRGLFEEIESLKLLPLRCPIVAERDKFPEEAREMLYGKRSHMYRVVFAIRGDAVAILRVHHASQRDLDP